MRKALMLTTMMVAGFVAGGSAAADSRADVTYTFNISQPSGLRIVRLNSTDMGFRFRDLRAGESRNVIAESGESVLVTNGPDSHVINVDGMEIAFGQADAQAFEMPVADDPFAFEDDAPAAGQQSILDRLNAIAGGRVTQGVADASPSLEIVADVGNDDGGFYVERLVIKKKKWKKK